MQQEEQQKELRQTARRLLEEGGVKVVIGYGRSTLDGRVGPVFITKPEDADQLVWNDECFANLTKYLSRAEVKSLGRAAICVKGCDEKALLVLEKESQIVRSELTVIGMACQGVGNPPLRKCESCDVHKPQWADITVGDAPDNQPMEASKRYAELDAFMKKSPADRMAYWKKELARCVKCYACRQVCPMCYCRQCIVDKNRPVSISTSTTLKGNFAWNITRAFHLAGRCIGCDECTRVCPAGIDLRLLNLSLARAAEDEFHYRAGMDPAADPIIGAYSQQDHEEFIR